ncbi:hypothetical protein YC2023_061105 [Brassica napus]|uniref:Uncharacterized protein n=1 Tax=Brassica oleracea TaxID=3712 RepID=A0A3P6EZ87_BRAOL|nr:unnamed protein product [Brassica oleracea]
MRRSCRTTLAIKRPHRQRLKRRSLTNKITSNRPNPRTYPKNKATKDVKVHAKRSLLHQSTTTLPITILKMQQLYPREGKIKRKLEQRRLRSGSRDVRDRTRPGKDPGEKPSSSPEK